MLPAIVVVGSNHKSAPVEVRERLAFTSEEIPAALQSLTEHLAEAVILSTCNRVEVYAVSSDTGVAAKTVRDFLGRERPATPEDLDTYLYAHRQAVAVRHLFNVAAGLDSMLVGEPQILGQVKQALQLALDSGGAGPVLSRLFLRAITIGKKARTCTGISRHHLSIGHAAAELARTFFDGSGIRPRDVLIIGSGQMAVVVARTLATNGTGPILVANRTYERACRLAAELSGHAIRFDRIQEVLPRVDIVVSSSGAPHLVLHRRAVEQIVPLRNGRPLFLIDIAVPRDIDPAVASLAGVHLFDIDDLQGVCEANLRQRQREADKAGEIVAAEAARFVQWLDSLAAVPTIRALFQKTEAIRQAEVEKALHKLGDLSPQQTEIIHAMSRAIVNKLLHDPVVHLKQPVNGLPQAEYLHCARRLFGLSSTTTEVP